MFCRTTRRSSVCAWGAVRPARLLAIVRSIAQQQAVGVLPDSLLQFYRHYRTRLIDFFAPPYIYLTSNWRSLPWSVQVNVTFQWTELNWTDPEVSIQVTTLEALIARRERKRLSESRENIFMIQRTYTSKSEHTNNWSLWGPKSNEPFNEKLCFLSMSHLTPWSLSFASLLICPGDTHRVHCVREKCLCYSASSLILQRDTSPKSLPLLIGYSNFTGFN